MVIDLISTYSMTDADYDKIIQLVAENKTNRNGCEKWADFVRYVQNKVSSTLAANNHATYVNVIKDINAKKKELSDTSKIMLRELEIKVILAQKALDEAENNLKEFKSTN